MAFSRTEQMFYLIDYRGAKAGTPVRFSMAQLSRLQLLAAKGVIGTKSNLDSEASTEKRVKDSKIEEVKVEEKIEEVKVEEKIEESAPEASVSIEVKEPSTSTKRSSKKSKKGK